MRYDFFVRNNDRMLIHTRKFSFSSVGDSYCIKNDNFLATSSKIRSSILLFPWNTRANALIYSDSLILHVFTRNTIFVVRRRPHNKLTPEEPIWVCQAADFINRKSFSRQGGVKNRSGPYIFSFRRVWFNYHWVYHEDPSTHFSKYNGNCPTLSIYKTITT